MSKSTTSFHSLREEPTQLKTWPVFVPRIIAKCTLELTSHLFDRA
jgi:hypothetical protein